MVDPDFIVKADNYMRQMLNRENKYYGGTGLYFIESQGRKGVIVKILPDAKFRIPHYLKNKRGEKAVELSTDTIC